MDFLFMSRLVGIIIYVPVLIGMAYTDHQRDLWNGPV